MSNESVTDWVKLDFEQARTKHLLFKSRLRSILYGADVAEAPVVSHEECTLGKWIYNHALDTYAFIPEMQQLEQVHKELHSVASRLVGFYKEGKINEARNGLDHIEKIAEELLTKLASVEIKVNESQAVHLEGSSYSDSLEINADELSELQFLNADLDRRIKEQSQELSYARERFELVAKATHDAIWDWNLLNDDIWWNDGFKELFGYKDEEIEPTIISWYSRVHPEDKERVVGSIHEVIDHGGTNWSSEYRFKKVNGDYAFVYDRGYALHDAEGTPYRMLGSMQEITERKQAEQAIRERETRFRQMANSLPIVVWTAAADGTLTYISDQWEADYGNNIRDSLEKGWSSFIHPEDMATAVAEWETAIETGARYETEFRVWHKSGSYRWVLVRAVPATDDNGNIERWYGSHTDIHDKKADEELLESRVKERTLELEMKNNELEQFIYVSHHDLQEPLRKMITFGEMVRTDAGNSITPVSQTRLDKVTGAARRMSAALRDVLDLASLNKEEQFARVELDEVLGDVLTELELVIAEKAACIVSDPLPVINGVRHQIHQLLYNLLNNALKFSSPGQVSQISISSGTATEAEIKTHPELLPSISYHKLTVRDNGIGFDQLSANKIFVMFQRLHSKESYPGTGIGLALCKKVVLNHRGAISAVSKAGEGATFSILLPAQRQA